jgi:hypothetical protein
MALRRAALREFSPRGLTPNDDCHFAPTLIAAGLQVEPPDVQKILTLYIFVRLQQKVAVAVVR